MDLDAFIALRPFVFHTTAAKNLHRLRKVMALESTRRLFELAERRNDAVLVNRRRNNVFLRLDDHDVVIRDQRPIAVGAIAFEPGWDLPKFLAHLNGFVFFWPGVNSGPIRYGRNHFQRYCDAGEDLAILRVDTRTLVDANDAPRFSCCNSGSARMNAGKKVPRGSKTFLDAPVFVGTAGSVKEVVFENVARLPQSTQVATSFEGPWNPLV